MDGVASSVSAIGMEIATAVDGWLCQKKKAWLARDSSMNVESLMGEALLMIAVAECLLQRGWKGLRGEWAFEGDDYDKATLQKGSVNFDLFAKSKDGEETAIEWKYIKPKKLSNQRLITDFVKLALPRSSRFPARYLLVVNGSESSLLRDIIGKTEFSLDRAVEGIISADDGRKKYSVSGDEKARIEKLMGFDKSLTRFFVKKAGEAGCVSIFSVSRA